MRIVVSIKQTFTTEARIAIENGAISDKNVKYIVNPYDEFAVEEAIKAVEAKKATEVVVVTVGPERANEALRQCLAMGADAAYRIWDNAIPLEDAWDVHAALLAKALEKLKPWDLFMAGKVAVDDGAGTVAPQAAALLGIPQIHVISKMEIQDGKVLARREMDGYQEMIEAPLPCLITADKSLNVPRYPTLPNIMKAKKKPLTAWTLADIGFTPGTPKTQRLSISLPPAKSGAKIVPGEPAEAAQKLVDLLHNEAKVI